MNRTAQATDAAVVLDTQEDSPALEICKRTNLFGEAVGVDVVPLELDARVLAVAPELIEFGFQHAPT
jgi:hypothetical protein